MSVPGKREQMGNGKREQMGNAEAAHRSREQTGNVQKPSGTVTHAHAPSTRPPILGLFLLHFILFYSTDLLNTYLSFDRLHVLKYVRTEYYR